MVLCLRRIEDGPLFREMAADPDAFFEYLDTPTDAGDLIDFDKAWQALHFLLTGSAWAGEGPLTFLLHAGREIGEDAGYGPVRLASLSEVHAFRNALTELDDAALRRRYDPAAMAAQDVYLASVLADEGEEGWDYVAQSIPALRRLLDRSVETGSEIAIWIS